MQNTLQDLLTLSLSIFVEALPFIILGSLIAGLVNIYMPPTLLTRILPSNSYLRRMVLSLTGFALPVCECGNVPVARALINQGLKPSEAITFLLAAPILNPVTLWSTWAAFGYDPNIVYGRIIAGFLIANIIGFVLARNPDETEYLTDSFQASCNNHHTTSKRQPNDPLKLRSLSSIFTQETYDMLKMLAFGALAAGVIQTVVSRSVLTSIGSNVILAIVAMLILAFVISICANVDAFFALSFAQTFTAGSILSFLVFGPMVDIKMLALLRTTFRPKLLIIMSSLSLLLSALVGLGFTYAF